MNISLFRQKQNFLAKVFANLLFQLFVFYITVMILRENGIYFSKTTSIVLSVISLIVVFFLIVIRHNMILRFFIFILFSLLSAALFNRFQFIPDDDLKKIVLQVSGVFLIMILIGGFSALIGYNLRPLGLILFLVLIGLIIFQIITIFQDPQEQNRNKKIISRIGVILFTIYIAYDSNEIMQRNFQGDFIDAGVSLFLDIINLISFESSSDL